ncbi:MAG: GntR family transcriptional regulator [Brevibacillus sp.]|nr:GntR family transcriptional regulator [Brevibacillus sp.]
MKNQTEATYQFVKQKILDGTFKPMQKLIETQLAESVGVNRNTVKKALMKLQQDHLVVIEDNRGATVKSFTLEEVIAHLEIIEVLDGLIAKSAAQNIQEAQLLELADIIQSMQTCIEQNQIEELVLLTNRFYDVIYESAKNQTAVAMVHAVRTPLWRYHFRTLLLPGRKDESVKEMQNIFVALQARQPDQAEKAIRTEMSHIRSIIEKNYTLLF